MRYFKDGELEEIHKIIDSGGMLWFIERTDTNQFFYEPIEMGLVYQGGQIEN